MSTGPGTGQHFGAYRLEALIGRGGMGVVHRAEHEHLGRTVALKLLAPDLADSEGFRGRFMRESRLAASLDHPSVVTVYDAGEVAGTLYIAMRFVDGTDLAELLRSAGSIAPDRALALLGQIASALDAAHALGLVHRDVKPANVLVEGNRAYLTDFGLTKPVKSATEITAAGQFLGTVAYVAPEQIQGRDVDGRADVYALGCVLFECITGKRPFVRDTDVAVLFAHLNEPAPRLSDVRPGLPAGLDAVLAKALAKTPDQRYPTCMALIDAARTAIERPEPAAEPQFQLVTAPLPRSTAAATPTVAPAAPASAPPAAPPERPAKRRGGLLAGAGAAVAAAAVAGALAFSGGGGESDDGGNPPSRDESSGSIPVGDAPVGVTVAGGYLWVANSGDDTVTRVRPDGSDRTAIKVGDNPSAIDSNGDAVWVTNAGSKTVDRIAASSGERIEPSLKTEGEPAGVVVNSRRAFVVNAGSDSVSEWYVPSAVPRRDPFPAGSAPRAVVVVPPAIWTANSGDDTIVRLEHGIETDRVKVGKEPVAIAASSGSLWVADRAEDTVTRIDLSNPGGPAQTIGVGDEPSSIAVGEGYVWVANAGDDTVMRLDDAGGKQVGDAIDVPGRPTGIAIGEGAVWVTTRDRDRVVRIEP